MIGCGDRVSDLFQCIISDLGKMTCDTYWNSKK